MEQHGLEVKFGGDASPLRAAANKAGQALNGFKRQTGDATQSLMNLSRVAQDAPYGFMGIANNLNPLLESFQRLKAETGSTKTALSALVAGLTGPAGIGLALGVASSLLVTFGSKLFESGEKTEELDQDIVRLNKSLAESKQRLDAVSEALQYLNTLGSINISIMGQSKTLDLQGEYVSTNEALQQVIDERARLYKIWGEANGRFIRDESDENKKAAEDAYKAYEDAAKKETELRQKTAIISRTIARQRVEDGREAAEEVEKNLDKERKAWQKYLEELEKAKESLRSFARIKEDFSQVPSLNRPDISGNFLAGQKESEEKSIGERDLGLLPTEAELKGMIAVQTKAAADAAKVWEEFNQRMNDIMADIQTSVLEGLGEGIGAALSGGGMQGVFAGLFGAIGSALQELGKTLIATSAAMTAFKTAFKSLNPVVAAAAGVGMIALGGALKAKVSQIKTFAQGGIVSTPTMGVFGEYAGARNNPEIVAPLNKLKGMLGDVGGGGGYIATAEISGEKLLLLLARAERKQGRTR